MRIIAIIQARMGSSRLPGKVLTEIEGRTVLEHVIERVRKSTQIEEVIVATTVSPEDLKVVALCAGKSIPVYIGSEEDVLDRYYQAARLFHADHVVRITADCPLHDARIIDAVIKKHLEEDNDYTSNVNPPTFPDGLDCEVVKMAVLKNAWQNARMQSEREHVTLYIRNQKEFKKGNYESLKDRSNERWTLDTDKDLAFIRAVYKELYRDNTGFTADDIYELLSRMPQICGINKGIQRNEGLMKSLESDSEYI